MSKEKISREQLKEDEFFTLIMKAKMSYDNNKKLYNGIVIAILVVIFGGMFINNQMKGRNNAAVQALGAVELMYYQNNFAQAVQLGEDMMKKYKDTKYGGFCALLVAHSYYNMSEIGKAETFYQNYVDDYGDNELYAISALEGLGNCYSQQGKFAEAGEKYLEGARKYSEHYSVPFLLNKSADSYRMAANGLKANEIYTEILEKYPDYPQIDLIKINQSSIAGK